jgi:hypothetical protein
MTQDELRAMPLGVYRLFWRSGGHSVASVGMGHDGTRWMAPANWLAAPADRAANLRYWRQVERVELIAPIPPSEG